MTNTAGCGPFILAERVNPFDTSPYMRCRDRLPTKRIFTCGLPLRRRLPFSCHGWFGVWYGHLFDGWWPLYGVKLINGLPFQGIQFTSFRRAP